MATDVETQHTFDASTPLSRRFELLLHSRFRTTTSNGLGLYQFRTGPVISFDATKRVSLLAGYYYTNQEKRDDEFVSGHRVFGGASIIPWEAKSAAFEVRGMVERFLPEDEADYTRYRTRFRLSTKRTVAPYVAFEVFFDREGYRSARYETGIRWRAMYHVQLDFGYFYEERATRLGFDRHMITTSLHFRRRTEHPSDPNL